MAFNFKQYTANNPLLNSINEDESDPTVSNVDQYAEDGGLDEESEYPLMAVEKAAMAAKAANIDRETVIDIVNQTYGVGLSARLNEDIDIWQMAGDHLEDFRSELANAYAIASENKDRDWLQALNKIAIRLDALEGAMAEANAKLGVLRTN